ncbi:MAG TPA: glycosyl hydrolase family 79 C-terminal domain-containing protein [Verrucomicrobiae bacterium]
MMKILLGLFGANIVLSSTALAQSPIALTITNSPGYAVSTNFSGLSFGTISLKPGSKGYFFDSSDTQMVALFQQLGIRSLRIGGTSVDTNNSDYTPATADVDALFRFANAAGVKVIYSVQLENGDPTRDAAMAAYIQANHPQYLDCFAVGNEPNNYGAADPAIKNFPSYLSEWNTFAEVITNSARSGQFGGPDGDSSSTGNSWDTQFASAEAGSGIVTAIQFHEYVGGSSANLTIPQIINDVLSTTWDSATYPAEYAACGTPVLSLGLPYRFTEANSFYTGGSAGVFGGNDCFATALFSLDFMHWWALHDCQMACFHTSMWKYNGVFYPDSKGNYQVYPVGYGMKAFDLGGHGNVLPLGIVNTNGLNLTGYAVADPTNLYVTIINRENGTNARNAVATIQTSGFNPQNAVEIYLTAPNNDPSATNGITLGGSPISDNGPWQGQWTTLGITNGQCTVTVAACSAVVVKIAIQSDVPIIGLATANATPTITYTGTLLSSTNLAGPYLPVAGAAPPLYNVPIVGSQMFYRVRASH